MSAGLRCRQLKPSCARVSSAVRSRCPPGFSRSLLTSRPQLTLGAPSRLLPTLAHLGCSLTPGAPLPILPCLPHSSSVLPPRLPGCKRLHLTFGPSQRDRPSGRAKSRILCGLAGARPHSVRNHLSYSPDVPSSQWVLQSHIQLVRWAPKRRHLASIAKFVAR